MKTCFKKDKNNNNNNNNNLQIQNINIKSFNKYILGDKETDTYTFPFIDLFVYNDNQHQNENIYKSDNQNKNKLEFFNKLWEINEFFPPKKVLFNEILVSIPNNPEYFLKINYGLNYMTTFISNSYNHQEEKRISSIITKKI